MFIRILLIALAFILFCFSPNGQFLPQSNQAHSIIEDLLKTPTPTESQYIPSPTNVEVSVTPSPEEQMTNELTELAKQLRSYELDKINIMVQYPEYDDLDLVLKTFKNQRYKNLSLLVSKALEYNINSYTTLAHITGNILPSPLSAPKRMTPEEKDYVISQFLNSEGAYTNEKLFSMTINQNDEDDLYLSIVDTSNVWCFDSDGPHFNDRKASFEAVFLFEETIRENIYCIIGISDKDGNRMVTAVELIRHERDGLPIYYLDCIHWPNADYRSYDYVYELAFDNRAVYLQQLRKYRDLVFIVELQYMEIGARKYIAYIEKYSDIRYTDQQKAAIKKGYEQRDSRAYAGAGLLRSLWRRTKINYKTSNGYPNYEDISSTINTIMSIKGPKPKELQKYEDFLELIQAPNSIPIVDIAFRSMVYYG